MRRLTEAEIGDVVLVHDDAPGSPFDGREGVVEYIPLEGNWPYVVSVPEPVLARTNPNDPAPAAFSSWQLELVDRDEDRDFDVDEKLLPAVVAEALVRRNLVAHRRREEAHRELEDRRRAKETTTGITEGPPAPDPISGRGMLVPSDEPAPQLGGRLFPRGG